MSTITQIVTRLADRLGGINGVDQTSINEWLPPVKTASIALVIHPLGMTGQVERPSRNGFYVQSHKIPCEFWIKTNPAQPGQAIQKAREIVTTAIRMLLADQTLGGTVQAVGHYGTNSPGLMIEYEIADAPTTVSGVTYMTALVRVPVLDYADTD